MRRTEAKVSIEEVSEPSKPTSRMRVCSNPPESRARIPAHREVGDGRYLELHESLQIAHPHRPAYPVRCSMPVDPKNVINALYTSFIFGINLSEGLSHSPSC